jgi:hypothetical protein
VRDLDLIAEHGAGALWQGARPPDGDAVRRAGFHVLVLCAEEHQPSSTDFMPGPLILIHCPLDDTDQLLREHWIRAHRAGELVSRAIAREKKVLVTCQAGLNRSGLVSALALRDLTGMSGSDAVRIVKSRRDRALCNSHFVSLLERLPAREPLRREA